MGPFRLLLFSSIVHAKSDCAHVDIDKEWMHCLNSNQAVESSNVRISELKFRDCVSFGSLGDSLTA